ncbi:glycosyltransferase family 2 protein [Verrucomicrobium spinosum]|uniref:glycosyltransferase family 2 protein n=1 Tax=Verrucomicrobium spinosum TaxID=2736 RepID=UPI0001744B53|nr:glycosyltransferase family 2 protein [Verrucomicrobium spinosum]
MLPHVTIIITQRDTYALSVTSLENVLRHTPCPVNLIYVDGGSPPKVQNALRRLSTHWGFQLLREDRILAPNEAKCMALPFIKTEFAAFLDNDVLVHPGWLQALIAAAEETGAGAVAPLYLEKMGPVEKLHMLGGQCRILEGGGHRKIVVSHDQRKGDPPSTTGGRWRTEHIEMHALLVRNSLLQRLPLFDPQIPSIPENADFCLTLLAAGEAIWIEPKARVTVLLPEVVHKEDIAFYLTRWSDDWIQRGINRFIGKWRLQGAQPVLQSQQRWAVAHRMVAYPDSLHRRLGIKSDSILNRRILAPLERYWWKR